MLISELNSNASNQYARRCYAHPSKLLSIPVEIFMTQSIEDQIQLIADLEFAHKQIQVAYSLIATGLLFRDRIDTKILKLTAMRNNIMSPGGYWPHYAMALNISKLIRIVEWDAIDTTMFCTMSHYTAMHDLFHRDLEAATAFRKAGITPKILIHAASANKWVSNIFKKTTKRIREILVWGGETGDTTISEVIKNKLSTILGNLRLEKDGE